MPGDVSLNGIEFKIVGSADSASNAITSLIDNLNNLKSALAETSNAASGGRTLKEFSTGVKELNTSLKGGSTKYKNFAEALADIAAAAELLDGKVSGITELSRAMQSMSTTKVSSVAFKNLASGLAAIADSTKNISSETLDNLDKMANSLAKLSGVDLKGLSSAMKAVSSGKSINPPSPVPDAMQNIIRSGSQIDILKLKLLDLKTALENAFNKGDLSGAIRIQQQISKVTAEIKKLEDALAKPVPVLDRLKNSFSLFGNAAMNGLKLISKGVLVSGNLFGRLLAYPFKEAGKSATGFAKSLGGVVRGLKRILFYRMIRTIIKEIAQAITEGIKNLYGWSKLMGGAVSASGETFAQSLDRITTSLAYFKNSIGAAVSPIIGALAPAIDYLIDRIVTLLNLINQLLARLSGASSWNRAIKKAQEFGAAAGGAGKAAKEALAYLAPFDELNRLPADNGSGGGGGGGGADYSGLFEEVTEFNQEIADFADKVREAVSRADWQGLGTLIGDKINELVERIDAASLGKKIGEKINALFTTQYWTLKTINFQNIGKKIAEFLTGENGIGGAIRAIDFTSIGGLLAEKLTMLPDILIGAVNNLDFKLVGKSVGDFLRGFFDDITEFIQNVDWAETFQSIVTGIIDFFDGLEIGSIAESILRMLGAVIGAIAQGLGQLLTDVAELIVNPDNWVLLWAWIEDIPAKMKNAGIKAINALVNPIVEGLNWLIEKINNTGLWDHIDPIKFDLIPEIPDEELNKNYNRAKAEIEARSKQDPVKIDIEGVVTKMQDNVNKMYKKVDGLVAKVTGVDISDAPVEEIPSVGYITQEEVVNTLKARIPSVGNVNSTNVGRGVEAEVPSKADINSSTTRNLNVTPSIISTANITDSTQSNTLTTPIIGSTGSIISTFESLPYTPKIDSTGNITKSQVQSGVKATIGSLGVITETSNNAKLKTPQIPSTGDVVGTKINTNLTKPIVDSTGKLVDSYVDNYKINKPDIASRGSVDYAFVNSSINKPDVSSNANITSASISDNIGTQYLDIEGDIVEISGVPESLWLPIYGYETDDPNDISTLNTGTKTIENTKRKKELGGAYFGGAWHDIPQAAMGGSFHGTLFWAGEAGAEVVGHAGGRTEVLNRSQLASTMYAAVSNALHGMSIKVASPSASAFGYEEGVDEESMYRAFRRALDETDFGGDVELDGETLYRAMVRRNNSNTRMTGVNAMAMA